MQGHLGNRSVSRSCRYLRRSDAHLVLSKYWPKKQIDAQVSGLHALRPRYPAPQYPTAGGTASPLGSQCLLLPKHLYLVHFSGLHTEFLYIQDVTVGAPMIHEPHQKSLRCNSAVARSLVCSGMPPETGLHPEAHLPKCLCPADCPATKAMLSPTRSFCTTEAPRSAHAVCPFLPTRRHSTGCHSPNSTPSHTKL